MLNELAKYGDERAKALGLDKLSEDEREDYVLRVIRESRQENRRK